MSMDSMKCVLLDKHLYGYANNRLLTINCSNNQVNKLVNGNVSSVPTATHTKEIYGNLKK